MTIRPPEGDARPHTPDDWRSWYAHAIDEVRRRPDMTLKDELSAIGFKLTMSRWRPDEELRARIDDCRTRWNLS